MEGPRKSILFIQRTIDILLGTIISLLLSCNSVHQGRIQDFLKGGSNVERGVRQPNFTLISFL